MQVTSAETARTFSAVDQEMIRWAVRWLPFDTGDEYIFPDFGVTPAVFYRRISALISAGAANHLEPGLRLRLRQHSSDKIDGLRDAARNSFLRV